MLPSFLENLDPEIYLSDNYVVLDFEINTSHGDYGHPVHQDNQMLLACWKRAGEEGVRARWGSEYEMGDLVAEIEAADFLVAHNAKYELGWLRRCGLDLRNVLVFDTKIAEYVLLGNLASGDKNMRPRSTSLDDCVRRRGGPIKDPVVDRMLKMGINPVQIPRPWLQGRCEQDVRTTEALFLDQRKALKNTGRLPVQYTRCLTTEPLADIEFEGMALDPEVVAEEVEAHLKLYAELERKMDATTGGINWRSAEQVAEFIYDVLKFEELKDGRGQPKRTPVKVRKLKSGKEKITGGSRLTDKDTLAALKAKTKAQKAFIALRNEIGRVNAALVKTLNYFHGIVEEQDGIFFAVFNQTATATHRLSSSGIETRFKIFDGKAMKAQFQNLPRAFKKLIRAKREGWLIGEWDGSQLEFRVAAEIGNDEQAYQDILDKHDVHKFTASVLNQVAVEDVTGDQRQAAKSDTFKPLYGGEFGTKRQMAYYKAFRERYHQLEHTQKDWVFEVCRDKRLITPWGMRYYWPYAKVNNDGYCNVKSAVYNYPVQALATAEIIPVALVYFWHRLREWCLEEVIRIVNTVHDSVICEVHPDYVEEFEQLAVNVWHDVYHYLEKVYGLTFRVPLGTEVNIGTHWSGKGNYKKAYDVFSDGEVRESK